MHTSFDVQPKNYTKMQLLVEQKMMEPAATGVHFLNWECSSLLKSDKNENMVYDQKTLVLLLNRMIE